MTKKKLNQSNIDCVAYLTNLWGLITLKLIYYHSVNVYNISSVRTDNIRIEY